MTLSELSNLVMSYKKKLRFTLDGALCHLRVGNCVNNVFTLKLEVTGVPFDPPCNVFDYYIDCKDATVKWVVDGQECVFIGALEQADHAEIMLVAQGLSQFEDNLRRQVQ